ncbi:chemotaxis protein CheB [Roseiterribacter gracilis]|uniref:Signal transduction histidine kinase n=1 Tax=Roseiterribacter gracilis TaxID=2812848 RepID=A0A8S8XFJ7_9PROT|nr:signal transduction histidine kinase [Rhodospirillales bacterium TMPK1]
MNSALQPVDTVRPLLVVGVGASAGGLAAFKTFFAHMAPDAGIAFVLIQHLDPNHHSLLVELLAPITTMPVVEAKDGMQLAANSVFVIPPNATMTVKDSRLCVVLPAEPGERRRPIDIFFLSLAAEVGENAVCIVLSGTGSDGTRGLQAVKEHGGLTLAQAMFDHHAMRGMPSSANASGLVDHVLPVEAMGALLVSHQSHLEKQAPQLDSDGVQRDVAQEIATISALLRTRLGHDFGHYKEMTLIRRVQRRMHVQQIGRVDDYVERLRNDPAELAVLFQDFLISVTEFMRDPDAFEALRTEVVLPLVAGKGTDEQIRVWVAGCATGEEAYSLAILFNEALEHSAAHPRVQIFATDLDDRAIQFARAGRYRGHLTGLSQQRVSRWFTTDGDAHVPIKSVRDMCVFSTHSVIKDPPYSKLDLISCRNVLIYMDAELQERVVRNFDFGLRPSGYLFLGSSESLARPSELFTPLDKKHRIFRCRGLSPAKLDVPAISHPTIPGMPAAIVPSSTSQDRIANLARAAMERYAPAYFVIDPDQRILNFSGGETGRYIEPSAGRASLDLFEILQKSLRPIVRSVLDRAQRAGTAIQEHIEVEIDGHSRPVLLIVEPLVGLQLTAGSCVVAFHDQRVFARAPPSDGRIDVSAAAVESLQEEARALRTQLRAAIHAGDASTEELRSANEEYQSVNEELQSTVEELETAKEETQSINEELQTLNHEMGEKNLVLMRLNSDLRNLFESTQVATLFLDGDLRIRSFTPSMTELFHLRASDRDRPVTDIVSRIAYPDLARDVANVLANLTVLEREVRTSGGEASFLLRIRPYRTVDNVVDGAVLTFVDITERRRQEEGRARLAAIVSSSESAIIGFALDGTVTSWNEAGKAIFGYDAAEMLGQTIARILQRPDDMDALLQRLRNGETLPYLEDGWQRADGTAPNVEVSVIAVRDEHGQVLGASAIARDTTQRVHAQEQASLLLHELRHRVKNALATVQSIAQQTRRASASADEFHTAFNARLRALAKTHDLLMRDGWRDVSMHHLLEGELEPYRAGNEIRWSLNGPDLALDSKATVALGLIFHELTTNAAKYGALSGPEGLLSVTWTIARNGTRRELSLLWQESGGPVVAKPARTGFGSRLIRNGLRIEFGGEVTLDFEPPGLRCTMRLLLPADPIPNAA